MTTKMEKLALIMTVFILASSLLNRVSIVHAQKNDGDYVNYSFNYSVTGQSQTKKGEGTFREEIIEDLDNGTIRVKYSGTVKNAVFMLEKNVPEEKFHFPYIPEMKDGTKIFKVRNSTFTITITKLPAETLQFQGSTYTLNVSKVEVFSEVVAKREIHTSNVTGILKVMKSGLLYSFSGEFKGGSTGEVTITLTAANLDPEAKGEANSLFMMVADIAQSGNFPTINSRTQPTSASDNSRSYALIGGLIAILAVIGAVTLGRRKIAGSSDKDDRPLHWVN